MKLFSKQIILVIGFVCLLIIILTYLKFPYTIKSPCRFIAQSEWSLTQLQPDKLSAKLVKNDSNKVKSFTLLQFDREDFVQFSLAPNICRGLVVQKDQIIGNIISSKNQLLLANLEGELEKAKANLDYIKTGEKSPIQAEAQQALAYAKAELAAFLPQMERKRQLYERQLISKEEWENVKATHDLYQLNVSLHEAKTKVVQTGEKDEAIRVIEAEISRLENQINVLQEKSSFEAIRSPIYGIITDPTMDNILCQVSKIDTIVIQIPVRAEQRKYIKLDQMIKISSYVDHLALQGKVNAIGNQARIINGRPMFVVSCLIKNVEGKILPGMTGSAKIYCDKISIFNHINRAWNLYTGTKISI